MTEPTGEVVLLPCPFCGDEGWMMPPTCRPETPYNPADRLYPIIRCKACYAQVPGDNEDYKGGTAIAAWNTRTTDAAQSSSIRELTEALEPFGRLAQVVDVAIRAHLGVGINSLLPETPLPVGGVAIHDTCMVKLADLILARTTLAKGPKA